MRKLELISPAKLNLYLEIIRKRKDNYHEIVTLFERIDLSDRVILEKVKKGITLVSNYKTLPLGEDNLAFRAAALLSRKLNKDLGVRIRIFKKIPLGAGLGGGSSNAASVLSGLSRLYELGIDRNLLFKWAGDLGSDVNFFLSEESFAIGKGRGNKIIPLALDISLWHILIYPNLRISTKDIYNNFEMRLTKRGIGVKILLAAVRKGDIDLTGKALFNSLEPVVLGKYPALSFWKEELLSAGAKGTLVSGSGSSVFGLVANRKEAERVRDRLKKLGGAKVFAVSTQFAPTV